MLGKRSTVNKRNNKGGTGIVLKEVSPNKLASKPINQEAQLDAMNISVSYKQGEKVGVDKENHPVFVPKPYPTFGTSTSLKPRNEKTECASALHRTGSFAIKD